MIWYDYVPTSSATYNQQLNCALLLDYELTLPKYILSNTRLVLPFNYFLLLKSYFHNRNFRVKVGNNTPNLHLYMLEYLKVVY
jgi:hypothetical protein